MSNTEGTRVAGTSEEEPLLGGRGDASLPEGKPLYYNFILGKLKSSQTTSSREESWIGSSFAELKRDTGTGVIAQAGAWIIAAIVWGAVFSNDLMLFSAHPLLNSAAFLFLIQALLIVQPTHTSKQKKQGTYVHAALNDVALLAALAGLIVIEYNKFAHNGTHFESPHAILGLVTYILLVLQAFVGVTQYFTPGLYGGVENAKSLYKYHRVGGYVTTLLMLATICAATQTTFNVNVLGIQLWAVVVTSVVVVVGLVPRIRLQKLGWMGGK